MHRKLEKKRRDLEKGERGGKKKTPQSKPSESNRSYQPLRKNQQFIIVGHLVRDLLSKWHKGKYHSLVEIQTKSYFIDKHANPQADTQFKE